MISFGVWIFYLLLVNHRVIGDKNGVNVTIMGANVADDGFVDFNERALGNWEVLCHTDNQSCCNNEPRLGEWFYPNGSKVLTFTDIGGEMAQASYLRNRGAGFIRLYRLNQYARLPSERGRFSCVVPNAQGNSQTYYVNILDIDEVTLSPYNPRGTVGQLFVVTCSVSITTNPLPENIPTPTFKWFYGPNKSMLITNGSNVNESVHNINNTYVSTIHLAPLSVSHAGIYTCQFGGNEGLNASTMITVNDPSILSVIITSDPASPITEGTAVTLTCTVKLNAVLMQLPANLSVLMQRDGSKLADGTPSPTMSSATFNYTLQVNSFGRNNAGTYACRASLNLPYSSISNTLTVTTIYAGVYLQLRDTVYSNNGDVLINKIGEGANSLICFTDLVDCCRSSQSLNGQPLGNWFYPDGSTVGIQSDNTGGFYKNRDLSRVRLNRRENSTAPLGLFCCEVPDATYNVIRVCANIQFVLGHTLMYTSTTTTLLNTGEEEEQNPTEGSNTSMGNTVGVVVIIVILFMVIFATTLVVICLVRCRKRAKYGRSTQNTFQMSIRETPQINIISPHDVIVTEGEGVYFKVKVSGVPQPTVTWYHDGEQVKADYAREIEEDGSLAIPSTELKHSGVYKAVVTNQHGSEEREVKLTVDKNVKADTADPTYDTADSVNNHYEIIEKGTNQQLPSGDYQMTQCPVYGMAPRLPEML